MNELLDFLASNPAFYVATVDSDNQPRVRPFSFVMEWDGKITLMTGRRKEIYRQLKANPRIEICSYNPQSMIWVRIRGRAKLFSDVDANREVFEVMPALKPLYENEYNPDMVCIAIEDGTADYFSMENPNGGATRTITL